MATRKKTASESVIKEEVKSPVMEAKSKLEEFLGGDKLSDKEEKILDWILNGIIVFILGWLGLGILLSIGGLFGLWGK